MLITCLTRLAAAKITIHDIRLVNAVWSPDSKRFHPDAREHLHVAKNGRILTNLFAQNRATVSGADGTKTTVNARSADRGAAVVAIRTIRSTGRVVQDWTVEMTSRTGNRTAPTAIFFGTDCGVTTDDSLGVERSEMRTVEMTGAAIHALSGEKFATQSKAWQDANWARHLESIGTGA